MAGHLIFSVCAYGLHWHLQLTLKDFEHHTVYPGISEQIRPVKLVGPMAEFKCNEIIQPLSF